MGSKVVTLNPFSILGKLKVLCICLKLISKFVTDINYRDKMGLKVVTLKPFSILGKLHCCENV